MQTNSDFSDLLDSPVGLKTIRKPYFDIIEWSVMIFNGLFTFLGVLLFWKIAFSSGTWLLFINPPCFILLFGLSPIYYIRKWRTASIEYDKTNDIKLLQNLPTILIGFVHLVTGIIWTLVFLLIGVMFWGVSLDTTENFMYLIIAFLILSPFIVLGPVQFFFIRMTKNITQNITK